MCKKGHSKVPLNAVHVCKIRSRVTLYVILRFATRSLFLMILMCFDCCEIDSGRVYKAGKVTQNAPFSFSTEMLSPEPFIWNQKGLEGSQNSIVPCRFSLFRHVVDFATPPYVFEVFRQWIFMFWALLLFHVMISSRNVTFFVYKNRPVLNPKRDVRKGN